MMIMVGQRKKETDDVEEYLQCEVFDVLKEDGSLIVSKCILLYGALR